MPTPRKATAGASPAAIVTMANLLQRQVGDVDTAIAVAEEIAKIARDYTRVAAVLQRRKDATPTAKTAKRRGRA